jgi:hypothetical protein
MPSFSSHRGSTGSLSYGSPEQRPSVLQCNLNLSHSIVMDSIEGDKWRGRVEGFWPVCVDRAHTWDPGADSIPLPSPPLQLLMFAEHDNQFSNPSHSLRTSVESFSYKCVVPWTTYLGNRSISDSFSPSRRCVSTEITMKAELSFPPELIDEITNSFISKIKPLLKQSNEEADKIFNVKDLAAYLNVSTKWVYERTHLREIPHFKAKGILGFQKKVIDKWLSTHNVPCRDTEVPRLRSIK